MTSIVEARGAAGATSQGLTATLAAACREVRYETLPPGAIAVAKHCLLDWLGVTIAGSREPLAAILREQAIEEGGAAQATLVGTGERVTASQAALVNGAASHALDFDDVHIGMSGHPSVPVLPALLALAEQRGGSGREFIAAFVAGYEMECRIGAYVMPGHYQRGFHATGTLGAFGAATACAHLLALGEAEWGHALGIAGAQAAGLKSMFGTMCKPLHAGKAAQNGLLAARLAARGFTSNPEVLETAQGFAATQAPATNIERALGGLSEDYAITGTLFKYHAACYGTHETIEGILRLKQAQGLTADAVDSIRLAVPRGHLAMCNIQEPATALEGKFSLRFTAALALADGDASERAFTDARVFEPRLTALRDRVRVEPHTGDHFEGGTEVRVRLKDGRELTERVDLNIPASDLERQWLKLAAKFRSLAEPLIGEAQAEAIVSAVGALETLESLGPVLAATVPAGGPTR
jgi:2-methylcitrate dehydratase PrpD